MLKKILYLSFAVFLIMFMWNVNANTNKLYSNVVIESYLYSNSSNCVVVQNDNLNFFKKGESYVVEKYQDIDKILEFYNAKLKIVETIDEGTNYYAYSKKLKYSKVLKGEIINLHIFIGKNKTVIGTPIIYGGY